MYSIEALRWLQWRTFFTFRTSCGFSNMNMLRHWERLLRVFPFSKLAKVLIFSSPRGVVHRAGSVRGKLSGSRLDLDPILEAAREFMGSDCAAQLEAKWDIWQYLANDWKPRRLV